MIKAYDGFSSACKEIGVQCLFRGPEMTTPEGPDEQIAIIKDLIEKKVDLIAIAANDANALHTILQEAKDKGIKVISYDSPVNKEDRLTHVQQANPEQIGRVLVQAAYEMVKGEGGIAILSAKKEAPNQNVWIEWMKSELQENSAKYAKTPLVNIVYGDDEPTTSTKVALELLENKKIKVIIAPTVIGMSAAGQCIRDSRSEVLLTGLGLPSEMAPFIETGICPWMYLWNPVDLGYLAAYTGYALVEGQITGISGDTFFAGRMGERVLTPDIDGGSEVMLGDPFKFDRENITEWKEVY